MADKTTTAQSGGLKKSDLVHSFAKKLLVKIDVYLTTKKPHLPNIPDYVAQIVQVNLLRNLYNQLQTVFSNPTDTCSFVNSFLMPHWKDKYCTSNGHTPEWYFDYKSLQDAQEEEIKKEARKLISSNHTLDADMIMTPEFINKCKEEFSFIFKYFEAMCDVYSHVV